MNNKSREISKQMYYLTKHVFSKKFKNYYLLLESEVLSNTYFSRQLELFFTTLKGNDLTITIHFPPEYKSIIDDKIHVNEPIADSLNKFYQLEFHFGQNMLPLCMFDYSMGDSTKNWTLYVSSNNELCIFGCDENTHSAFEVIFEPYIKESLRDKYNFLKLRFSDKTHSQDFITSLESNIHFSNQT